MESQVQSKGFQLTLPFRLGTTSLCLGESVKRAQRHLDRSSRLVFVGNTKLEGWEEKLKGHAKEEHIKSHLEK